MKQTLIPERLVKARERMNINKAQAAELVGLSPIGYLRYEQGLRVPSLQTVQAIALALNTSASYLTGETDDPAADQILVTRDKNDKLFELVMKIDNDESEHIERLLAYYEKIKK